MKILFLGNSLTYYNDLPKMLTEISGGALCCDSVTRGGAYLSEYSEPASEVRTKLDALLASGKKFDYVVLQEQSSLPATNPDAMLDSVKVITGIIPESRFVLYQTASYSHECERLTKLGMTVDEMTERLAAGYRKVGEAIGATVVPVGTAFLEAIRRGIRLHLEDASHPNPTGTYLAACLFYRAFTGKNAAGLADADGVAPDVAHEIRKIANLTDVTPVV